MIRKLGLRWWLAWMLVRLAEKIHFSEYEEQLIIERWHGTAREWREVATIDVVGDLYGAGVSAIFNNFPGTMRMRWISDGEEQELRLGGNNKD